MKTQTIVYVSNMKRSVDFFEALGFERAGPVSDYWTPFRAGSETLALHWAEEMPTGAGRVTLSLVADGKLEDVKRRLADADIDSTEIVDQPFGRSFNITDPDGLVIQVNEHAT